MNGTWDLIVVLFHKTGQKVVSCLVKIKSVCYHYKEHTFSFNSISSLGSYSYFQMWQFVYKIVSVFSGSVILSSSFLSCSVVWQAAENLIFLQNCLKRSWKLQVIKHVTLLTKKVPEGGHSLYWDTNRINWQNIVKIIRIKVGFFNSFKGILSNFTNCVSS